MIRVRSPLRRESLRDDGVAGVVLGVESVPDGLAVGVLAGVNPVSGLYAYLVGTVVARGWDGVAQLADLADVPRSLPGPVLPDLDLVVPLVVPAASLAFVGLVQGAAISANFPNPDGTYPDVSRDFVGQGAANVACGVFQGMPVGGSMSGSSLIKSAGAKSRQALLFAAVVMAVVIVVFASAVSEIALPALAGLIMLIGYRTIKPTTCAPWPRQVRCKPLSSP